MGARTHTLCYLENCEEHNHIFTHKYYMCNNRKEMCGLARIFGLETHSYLDVRDEVIKYLLYRFLAEDKPARGRCTPLFEKTTDEELEAQITQYIEHVVASNEEDRGLYYFLKSYGVKPFRLLELQDAVAEQFDSYPSTVNDKVIKYLKKNIGGEDSHDIATKELKSRS